MYVVTIYSTKLNLDIVYKLVLYVVASITLTFKKIK